MRFIPYSILLITALVQSGHAAEGGAQTAANAARPGSGPGSAGKSDFLGAYDAYRARNLSRLENFAQRLKSLPLEVYASYYLLQLKLEKAGNGPVPDALETAVKKFLARPEDTPVIDMLRAEWLKLLGKIQYWELFDAEFPRLIKEDPELTCYALQSRRRIEELPVLDEVRKIWFTGKTMPESCGALFDIALSAGIISEQDILQRMRLALEAGNVTLARGLVERLEGSKPAHSAALKSAAADADRYLRQPPQDILIGEVQRIIAMFALQRLAKQSTDLAVLRWEKLGFYFPEAEQHYFYGWLGYEAARNHDARALQWYRAAAYTPLNEQQSAWRVRAALRALDWPEVLTSVSAMSEKQQQDATWQYWKARALSATGRVAEAREIFARLSREYSYYGQLALEELTEQQVMSNATPAYRPDEHAISAIMALPGIRRTLDLYRFGLRTEALEEWRWVLRNLNDRELLAAAEIARRREMYDRAIGAAEKTITEHDFSLRYLSPYREELQEHIREHGLEEAWVYGLMRQESRFVTSAKSSAGAAGLMQIMPATARWVASKLGLKNYRTALIHQLDTNLRLGTYYMKTVLSQFDDSPVLATGSYNAGPNRARQWRGEQPLEGAIFVETIPFEETRDYVKKVMSNTVYYAEQFGDPPRSLKQRLGIIPGKPAADRLSASSDNAGPADTSSPDIP